MLAATTSAPTTAPSQPYPWTPDRGDGTYANPILCADYSDPDVIRVGDDFYLTASSFNCTPGLPILHSRDLVNWTIANYAIKNVPDPRYANVQPGCGVWAPAIRYHEGKYWIFFPTPDEGIYVTTATDPCGQWSEPHLLAPGKGLIDPCPLWDDDGKAYLVHAYARSRSGIKHRLRVCTMAADGSRLLDEGKTVYENPEKHPTLEGPKFMKRDGMYYILAPAGGVSTGWEVVLRSKHVFGPYEDKIVLEQGRSPINGPHQGALVDTPSGQWWFVHFQEKLPYGRIVHLQPAEWRDGWPVMGVDLDGNGIGEPALTFNKPRVDVKQPTAIPQTSDEFDGENSDTPLVKANTSAPSTYKEGDCHPSSKLGLQWQWWANHEDEWCSLKDRAGWLRLFAKPMVKNDLGKSPNLLLQKLPATSFVVETKVDASKVGEGGRAGLTVMGKSHAALAIENDRVVLRIDNQIKASSPDEKMMRLRVAMRDGGSCTFSFAGETGDFKPIGEAFQAVEGIWIGAKVGIFCVGSGGSADFDYFRFKPRS